MEILFNSQQEVPKGFAVALSLTSGDAIKGQITAGITGKLTDLINKPDPFIELLRPDGTTVLIAKAVVAQIEAIEVPKTDQLSKRLGKEGIPDPYTVLGVNKSASQLDIQSAYHVLARRYHPDHFSGREIPPEVLQYVSAMFQRITIAYNDLKENSDAA